MKLPRMSGQLVVIAGIAAMACGHAPPATPAAGAASGLTLTVIPAESDAFPRAARAVTASLAAARIAGVQETRVAKASLEVVQLSIECVDPSDACYEAVGRSLRANRLLFARIDVAPARKVKLAVTLYDVDHRAATRRVEKLFGSDAEAASGAPSLVAEVTR